MIGLSGVVAALLTLSVGRILTQTSAVGMSGATADTVGGASRAVPGGIEAQVIYTVPTKNDAALVLPQGVRAEFHRIGKRHGSIVVTRIDSDGSATTRLVDLTPRVGGTPDGEVLRVAARASAAVDASLAALARKVNADHARSGDRRLLIGLLKASLTPGVPIYVLSSGLDLAAPDDFRELAFSVSPDELVDQLRSSGELPDLSGAAVTFVLIPTTGDQEQLRRAQRDYVRNVWSGILGAAGAGPVRFVEATGGPSMSEVAAPVITLPALPGTPIEPASPPRSTDVVCAVSSDTYFAPDSAVLLDASATRRALRRCVAAAGTRTTVTLDAYTAYYGPRHHGRPARVSSASLRLSAQRAIAVADLLVSMGVNRGRIVRMTGHGSAGQPYPKDPGSARNRVVVIAFSTPTKGVTP